MKTKGAKIRERRFSAGLSQKFLAQIVGRSQIWVSSVERGLIQVSQENLHRILSAIDRVENAMRPSANFDDLRLPKRFDFENLKIAGADSQKGRRRAHDSSAA